MNRFFYQASKTEIVSPFAAGIRLIRRHCPIRNLGLLLIVIVSSIASLQAQTSEKYLSKHYSIENGLLQSSVKGLVFDKNGFLWIMSQGGVSRFDGQRFIHYTSHNSLLPNDRIDKLSADAAGRIHISVNSAGKHFFYIDENYFLKSDSLFNNHFVLFASGYEPKLSDSLINCIGPDGAKRLCRMNLNLSLNKTIPVGDREVYYLLKDSLLWVDYKSKLFNISPVKDMNGAILISDQLLVFDKAWNLSVWVGGKKLAHKQTTPVFDALFRQLQQQLSHESARFWARDNNIGILRVGKEIWQISRLNDIWDATLLYDNFNPAVQVTSLLYNPSNKQLFIGTMTDGLYVISNKNFETILFDELNDKRNIIYSQAQVNTNAVVNWYYLYEPLSGKKTRLEPSLNESGFCKSSDGKIWYSSRDNICIADSQFVVRQKISLGDAEHGTDIARIIVEDKQNVIWFSTYHSVGYIRNNHINFVFRKSSYFTENLISALFFPDEDRVWIGHSDGITVYNKKTNKVEKRFLAGNAIVSVYRARDGSIWVSTYGKGFYKYQSGQFISLPLDAGKNLLFTHCFIEDDSGFFWLPTNNGLFQCKKSELDAYARDPDKENVYYYLHKKAGDYTEEFNGGAEPAFVLFGKRVLLPSIKGVVSFDPEQVKPLLPDNEILIERIVVNDRIIKKEDRFVLPPGNYRLEIDVSAPYFGDEENNILEYQLSAFSGKWYPLTEHTIVYNSLPRGKYLLTIRKRTGFGVGHYAYKKIGFTIEPFWYQTGLVWALGICCIAAVIYLLVKKRISSLQMAKFQLEQRVAQRTTELEATVTELNLSEQELNRVNMLQEQALAVILHDIRSPLSYLAVSARYFYKQIHDLSQTELVEYSGSLMASTSSIDKFSNDLIQWLRLNKDNNKLNYGTVNLNVLFNRVRDLYVEIAAMKKGSIEIGTIAMDTIVADGNKLELVIRNLVDNATKHCQNGCITLSACKDDTAGNIIIKVGDTGNGMSAEELLQWQAYTHSLPDFQKDKLGLSMVYYFVSLMKGQLKIESHIEKGTIVRVILPYDDKG